MRDRMSSNGIDQKSNLNLCPYDSGNFAKFLGV